VADLRAAWLERVSGATVAREMTLLATILETARRDWGWLGANPARGVRRPPEPPPRRRGITADEIDRIVLALGFLGKVERPGHQVAVAFLLALETAMRAGEMIGLAWERVDLERRVARLPKTKNGDAREVALSARAVELLRLHPASASRSFRFLRLIGLAH
jgi:integrase